MLCRLVAMFAALPRFFADLKRRRVFRAMAVYGATSFASLEALSLLQPVFVIPGWVYRMGGLLVVAGFPVMLVVVWLFDYEHGWIRTRPASRDELEAIVRTPRMSRWAAGVLAVVGVALVASTGWYATHPAGPAGQPATRTLSMARSDSVSMHSIAVLPFVTRSSLPDDSLFVEGLHDDILLYLSRMSPLRLLSRTTVQHFRDTTLPIRAIADSLDARLVVEGAVQRSGDSIRVTVQLIDGRTDSHLLSERWDRELRPGDDLPLQDSLASHIAVMVAALADSLAFTTARARTPG